MEALSLAMLETLSIKQKRYLWPLKVEAGGGLEDDNGSLIDGAALIGATVGGLAFVGGQSIQQGKRLPYFGLILTLNLLS